MPKGSNKCQDCGEWRSFTKPHHCKALHASPDAPRAAPPVPAPTTIAANTAETGSGFEQTKNDYREAVRQLSSMDPAKFDKDAFHNSIVEMARKAEKYSTTSTGYAEVLLDVEYFADNGNYDRATILRTSADRGRKNAERDAFISNVPKHHDANLPTALHIPVDTFPARLEKLRDAERVLDKHEKSYEEAFRASGGLVYPVNMCVSCGHYHNTSGLRKSCAQKDCGCRKYHPATTSMDVAYRAFEGLEGAQGWRAACLEDVKKVYPGDKWFIAYGNLVGERGVSMKVEMTDNGPRVSILTYSGKNFWAPLEMLSREAEGIMPGEFDPS